MIKYYYNKYNVRRGLMKCILCGAETPDEELFCENCRDESGDEYYIPVDDEKNPSR